MFTAVDISFAEKSGILNSLRDFVSVMRKEQLHNEGLF